MTLNYWVRITAGTKVNRAVNWLVYRCLSALLLMVYAEVPSKDASLEIVLLLTSRNTNTNTIGRRAKTRHLHLGQLLALFHLFCRQILLVL